MCFDVCYSFELLLSVGLRSTIARRSGLLPLFLLDCGAGRTKFCAGDGLGTE